MQKHPLLVLCALFCACITACTKSDIQPVEDTVPVLPISTIASFKSIPITKNNIVILGGSTAWGVGASTKQNSWVYKLETKVKAVNKNDTIINLAMPGYTTYHIMENGYSVAKRPVADTLRNITTALAKHPILVIISLPSNDIANGYNDEEILHNYKIVVNTLIKDRIPYIITSTQPRNFSIDQRLRLRSFTDLLIKAFPGHVIDYLNKLGDSMWSYKPLYNCGDGIHPNDKGHDVIYNSFISFAPFKKAIGLN
jgi:acyl-CoA thioesterase-1